MGHHHERDLIIKSSNVRRNKNDKRKTKKKKKLRPPSLLLIDFIPFGVRDSDENFLIIFIQFSSMMTKQKIFQNKQLLWDI